MNSIPELIQAVESAGGRFMVDGDRLGIVPSSSAAPMLAELRQHKPEIIALLQSRTEQETESEPDSDALGLWMLARCVYRDRCWGGVGALHLDLARWCADCGRPMPASRRAFVMMLQAEGFEVTADGDFVYGLILASDWEAHEHYRAAPAGSAQPSRERLDAQPCPLPACNAYRAAQRAGNEASL
jgi:hypothetical protein